MCAFIFSVPHRSQMDGALSESLERLRVCPVDDPMVEPLLRSLVPEPPFSISVLRRCLKDWSTVTPYAEEVALAMARQAAGTADIVQLQMIYQLITRAKRPTEAPRGEGARDIAQTLTPDTGCGCGSVRVVVRSASQP